VHDVTWPEQNGLSVTVTELVVFEDTVKVAVSPVWFAATLRGAPFGVTDI
jgi:hypothetical protein